MNEIRTNERQMDFRDFGGGSGAHKPTTDTKNESRDYGKWVIIATLVVLFAAAVVMALI